MNARPPDALAVVVPVHNEDQRLDRCLTALTGARARAREDLPGTEVRIVVVLDRCVDGSDQVAAAYDVETHVVAAGCVGAARRAGVEAIRRQWATHPPGRVWTAHTDADTVVPLTWLVDHLRLAALHDVVIGRVVPDPHEIDPHRGTLWDRLHPVGALSVHGANLGIRLSSYDRAGGFAAVSVHEDRLLVDAALASGARWAVATTVLTSARLEGRTPGGSASYLRDLHEATTPVTPMG